MEAKVILYLEALGVQNHHRGCLIGHGDPGG